MCMYLQVQYTRVCVCVYTCVCVCACDVMSIYSRTALYKHVVNVPMLLSEVPFELELNYILHLAVTLSIIPKQLQTRVAIPLHSTHIATPVYTNVGFAWLPAENITHNITYICTYMVSCVCVLPFAVYRHT